jgi:hypothetical protein
MTIEALDGRFAVRGRADVASGLLKALPAIGRVGLGVLVAGWALLAADPLLAPFLPIGTGGIFVKLGQSAIMTGAALAIIGLGLSGTRQGQTESGDQDWLDGAETEAVVRAVTTPPPAPPVERPAMAELPKFETMRPEVAPAKEPERLGISALEMTGLGGMVVVARGQVDDRCFLVLSDGTIVIETLLGQRRFKTLVDARDFIGGGTFLLHDTVNIPLKTTTQGIARSAGEPTVSASRVLRHV